MRGTGLEGSHPWRDQYTVWNKRDVINSVPGERERERERERDDDDDDQRTS